MRICTRRLRGGAAVTAVTLVALAETGGASSLGSAAAAPLKTPPCTRSALVAGLRRGHLHGSLERGFRCAGRFAYSGVLVGGGENQVTITVLFRAGSKGWAVASRARYCANGSVPKRIRRGACETN
jgi:hypothetical protein